MKSRLAYAMISPGVAVLIVCAVIPIGVVAVQSLNMTDYIVRRFVGLANYARILRDATFHKALGNTLYYAVVTSTLSITISLTFAMAGLHFGRLARSYIRFVFFIPILAAGIVIGTCWKWIFHPSAGALNYLLSLVRLGPVYWLGTRWTALPAICLVLVTSSLGFQIIMFMAAVGTVGPELFDASRIDGATERQIRWRIILPMITPTVALLALISFIGSFQVWETIYMLTRGGPDNGTISMMFDVYETGFIYGRFGLASTKSIALMTVLVVAAIIKRRLEA